ncbi:MAG TPA: ATP-binding protein [Verrucomicrobiae bacterium]|nr:ATP-binding protein [Verrucomicrobiae bacterium]
MKIQLPIHDEEHPLCRYEIFDADYPPDFDEDALRMREELKLKTAMLASQLDCSPDGISIVDAQGRKLLQNQKFADLFKIPREIANGIDDERQLRWVIEAIKDSEQFVGKLSDLYSHPLEADRDEIELNDGTILEWRSFPALGQDGALYGRLWIYRDVTERKRMEARLSHSQKMEMVGRMAGCVAHEFNNLMTRIIGQGGLMLDELAPKHSWVNNVTEINQAAARAAVLSHQLLGFARKQALEPDIIDINTALVGMEEAILLLAGRNVAIHFSSSPGLKLVKADIGQIEQVIFSIVINAADAMPHGGDLGFEVAETTLEDDYTSQFADLTPGDYILLAITDSGPGMTGSVKARAFEPFFTTKDADKGAGLGLATSRRLMSECGGHIAIYSDRGWGTSVRLYLPKMREREKASAAILDKPCMPTGVETILLVEDNPSLLKLAATLLTRLGYCVLTAVNEMEALKLAGRNKTGVIDLLLTDVVMPQMSGKELSDRVHSLFPRSRTLFSSAYDQTTILPHEVLDRGVGFLQKPYTPSMLATKVREALNGGCIQGNGL